MNCNVASMANRDNVIDMLLVISVMVMVLVGLFSTHDAQAIARSWDESLRHGNIEQRTSPVRNRVQSSVLSVTDIELFLALSGTPILAVLRFASFRPVVGTDCVAPLFSVATISYEFASARFALPLPMETTMLSEVEIRNRFFDVTSGTSLRYNAVRHEFSPNQKAVLGSAGGPRIPGRPAYFIYPRESRQPRSSVSRGKS